MRHFSLPLTCFIVDGGQIDVELLTSASFSCLTTGKLSVVLFSEVSVMSMPGGGEGAQTWTTEPKPPTAVLSPRLRLAYAL